MKKEKKRREWQTNDSMTRQVERSCKIWTMEIEILWRVQHGQIQIEKKRTFVKERMSKEEDRKKGTKVR